MEKTVVVGAKFNFYNYKRVMALCVLLWCILAFCMFAEISSRYDDYEQYIEYYNTGEYMSFYYTKQYDIMHAATFDSATGYAIAFIWETPVIYLTAIISTIIFFVFRKLNNYAKQTTIVVTTERIYGQLMFGKKVDIPIENVTSISTRGKTGITVWTTSGGVKFTEIANREDVYRELQKLIYSKKVGQ